MTANVEANYTRGGLQQAVLDAIVADGYDPDDLDPEALAPAEEFHTFGRAATVALAEAASITADDRVIDVGSGLGGPARYLARVHGCHVVGVDLTQELCDVAADLTRRVGLSDRVEIRQGDALALPFPDGSFDVAWTQHVSMNIADKAGFYAEMRRVLRPGGRLAFFDLLSGPDQPIHFPVPWAEDPASSASGHRRRDPRPARRCRVRDPRSGRTSPPTPSPSTRRSPPGPHPTSTSACTC